VTGPVKLSTWFAQEPTQIEECAQEIVAKIRCNGCLSRCEWEKAWGHITIAWGEGYIWCCKECLDEVQ